MNELIIIRIKIKWRFEFWIKIKILIHFNKKNDKGGILAKFIIIIKNIKLKFKEK